MPWASDTRNRPVTDVEAGSGFRRFINILIKLVARLMWVRVEVSGLERVPLTGPLIIMINHINFLDAPLALAYIPRDKVAMTKAELFRNPILGPLAKGYGIFGIRRGQVDRAALQNALDVLRGGMALLFSPEGHRSGHGRLQQARNGIAFIASEANAPILPVAIYGGEQYWENIKRLRATRVHMAVGRPFRFRVTESQSPPLAEMSAQAMYQLATLLPERYRGKYGNLDQATDQHLEFLTIAR